MKKIELTEKEKMVLFGLVKYPPFTDKKLAQKIKLKHSTVTSIRHRLKNNEYFRKIRIPRLQNMGCQMLVVIYTNFSPLIPLEERIEITGKTIEVFEEIFFSIGEEDKGFSLSLSKEYSTVGRINDIRTQTFGKRGLLEDEYPSMVVFPFDISRVYRFFDFAPLIKKRFGIMFELEEKPQDFVFKHMDHVDFSDTEKNVYCMLISYPEMSDSAIAREIGVSRYTVSLLRRRFEENKLIRMINIPNLKNLGFEILTFYHIKFDPNNFPDMDHNETAHLMSESTILFTTRMFEAVMISVYQNYDDYKTDMMNIMRILKENKWISREPIIKTYGLNTLIYIKEFKFAPITQKIIGCDYWVKKLLNI